MIMSDLDISNEIRKRVIKGKSVEIRDLILNKNQLKLLKKIGTKEVNSRWVARLLSTSVQNANMKLERLRKTGYLTREMSADPTGGLMYLYECTPVCLN